MNKLILSILTILFLTTPGLEAQTKVIHVFVALADNNSQGIVPVPPKLGNGNDPFNNLYWGALYGVKTYFRKNPDWKLLSTKKNISDKILERCTFQYKKQQIYLVADAYKGSEIKNAITDFLSAAAGHNAMEYGVNNINIMVGGGANLVAYVGHNGLMDFSVSFPEANSKVEKRTAIILACKSKQYFLNCLIKLNAKPLLLTTGLMAPEAYTLCASLKGWINKKTPAQIKEMAANAYNRYQKCGINGARKLFYCGGW